jgi:hypothetical protein
MKDSTGLFYSEIVARVEEHAQFLLLHMLKSESIAFKATTIYKWLIEEFSVGLESTSTRANADF